MIRFNSANISVSIPAVFIRQFLILLLSFWLLGPIQAQTNFWLGWQGANEKTDVRWQAFGDSLGRKVAIDSALSNLRSNGYLGASVDRLQESGDSLWVEIYQGPKIDRVALTSKSLPPQWREDLEKKEALSFEEVNSFFGEVLDWADETGYPFASLQLDSLNRDGDQVFGQVDFQSGPLILWDSVQIEGNSVTKKTYLQRLTGIHPGDPFSQKDIERSLTTIRRSPYFRLQGQPRVDFRLQKASPAFRLEDRKANVLDGILGVLPNENEPGKVLVTGQLDLALYHLGGKGRDVELHWQRFNELTQSLSLRAKESFIFGSRLDVSGEFSLLKQDTSFVNRKLGLRFGYRSTNWLYFDFFVRRQAGDLISTAAYSEVEVLPELADFRWTEYGINARMDWLDDAISPRKGGMIQLTFSAGNKEILQNTGIPPVAYEGIDLRTPQYALSGFGEKHVFITKNWGLYFRGAAGLIRNENLFQNDLYRLGGLQSIRGFNENFFFARDYFYLNAEPRLFFGANSFLFLFSDFGFIENPYFAAPNIQPFSLGAGLNLETGNGIFRFVYAVGKTQEQPLSLQFSKIHFGYIVQF